MPEKFLIIILSFMLLFPIAAQENDGEVEYNYDDEEFYDDWLLMDGGGLTILGSANTTQHMEIVDRETIEKTRTPDIPSLLQETLGLGVTRYGPYGNIAGVNIRGFDVKRVAILVDGIPMNSGSSGDFNFYSIDPLSIERIEVIHGGSDAKYNVSGALGGIINIITVKKPNPGWGFGGSFANTSYLPGQYNRQGILENPQWQDLADSQNVNIFGSYGTELYSVNLSAFGNRAGNYFLYLDDNNITRRKEGNEILDGGASLSFLRNVRDLSKFLGSFSFYFGDKNIPVSGYISDYVEQNDISSRTNLMLDMPRAFHDDFSMELSLGHNWKRSTYDLSRHDEHNLSLINRWSWYPGTKFTLRFGGDYRFIGIDSTNTGVHYANRGGLYITPEYSPARSLLLIASIKGITDGRTIVPIPKLGWSWAVNKNFTLKNNYFRSFKFPDFDDLYWEQSGFMGNPDLKNEDGWGMDLGAEFSYENWLSFNTVVYGEWTKDSIHWNNMSGSWRPENYGAATFIGWDNKANFILPIAFGPLEKPILALSWVFQLSWLLSGDLSFNDSRRIPYMPMHTLGASLELPWKTSKNKLPGTLIISSHFESSRFTETQNIIELDPCFLLNITYNQKLNRNIGIFGKLNNVLNTSYTSFAAYPMPGINLTLGMNMIFEGLGR